MSRGFIDCSPWRSCYFHTELKHFLIIFADDFKLAGPADKGIEIDPQTGVGRYLGCERRLSTRLVELQGELPAILDPPPPKVKKNASVPDESAEEEAGGDSAAQPPEPCQPREPKQAR
eukprot:7416176-Pyramimonas_sp.AAC.2